jgi:hypothetical protein
MCSQETLFVFAYAYLSPDLRPYIAYMLLGIAGMYRKYRDPYTTHTTYTYSVLLFLMRRPLLNKTQRLNPYLADLLQTVKISSGIIPYQEGCQVCQRLIDLDRSLCHKSETAENPY